MENSIVIWQSSIINKDTDSDRLLTLSINPAGGLQVNDTTLIGGKRGVITLNATGSDAGLGTDVSGFYVAPIRDTSSGTVAALRYDINRNEIMYSNFGIYGVGVATFGEADLSSNVLFPGITTNGIVLITPRYSGGAQNVGTISVDCRKDSFVVYRITSGASMDVSWAVVKL